MLQRERGNETQQEAADRGEGYGQRRTAASRFEGNGRRRQHGRIVQTGLAFLRCLRMTLQCLVVCLLRALDVALEHGELIAALLQLQHALSLRVQSAHDVLLALGTDLLRYIHGPRDPLALFCKLHFELRQLVPGGAKLRMVHTKAARKLFQLCLRPRNFSRERLHHRILQDIRKLRRAARGVLCARATVDAACLGDRERRRKLVHLSGFDVELFIAAHDAVLALIGEEPRLRRAQRLACCRSALVEESRRHARRRHVQLECHAQIRLCKRVGKLRGADGVGIGEREVEDVAIGRVAADGEPPQKARRDPRGDLSLPACLGLPPLLKTGSCARSRCVATSRATRSLATILDCVAMSVLCATLALGPPSR